MGEEGCGFEDCSKCSQLRECPNAHTTHALLLTGVCTTACSTGSECKPCAMSDTNDKSRYSALTKRAAWSGKKAGRHSNVGFIALVVVDGVFV